MTAKRRRRGYWLITTLFLAVVAVACGRATEDQINAALGITPTATMTAAQIATSTSEAATAAANAALGIAPSPGQVPADANFATLGNPVLGKTQFIVQCQRCHTPAGTGPAPALAGATNPAASLSDAQLYALIKDGTNHGKDAGGPGANGLLTDQQIYDVIAFLRNTP